jgi:sigma-B regulation protein RsbU (phosphoserine phosphatase)
MGQAATVRVLSADRGERRLPLQAKTIIGRDEDADVFVADHLLSRRHAAIELRTEGCFLIDLASKNGTFLNGQRVTEERQLSEGDVIALGSVTLVFEQRPAREAPAAPARPAARTPATSAALDVGKLMRDDRVLGALSLVTSALMEDTSPADLFGRIVELVLQVIPAERAAILLLEGQPPALALKAARGRGGAAIPEVSGSIARRALEEDMALLLHGLLEDPELRHQPSIAGASIRTAMCAPLWLAAPDGARVKLGVIYLDSRLEAPFGESDLHVLTVLANFLGMKIESVRLAEERRARRQVEQEMRLAAEVHAQLLPQKPPRVPGYEIAGMSRPWYAVGGDYYDYAAEPQRLLFALGDVSGKGVAAGMLMAALRATVRACWRAEGLATAVGLVNRHFLENIPGDRYATCFLARVELATGRLVYVNAGHNRPLLVRARADAEPLATGGTILGAFEDATWSEGTAMLAPGDTLLVFSDGVSDCWPDDDAADRALVALVRAHAASGAEALGAGILAELARRSGAILEDDRTVLVVRRLES